MSLISAAEAKLFGKQHKDLAVHVLTLIPVPCLTNTGEETIASTMGNRGNENAFRLDKLKELVRHPSSQSVSSHPMHAKEDA